MPYITKKTPVARSTDTPLGKIMGYVAEMLEYLRWENACGIADAFFPDWFPLNVVQDTIINIFRRIYDDIYQEAYNNSANKGNEMNGQIMGWLDDIKNQAFAKVNEAQTYIQNTLINPIKSKIDNEITPRINQAISKLSTVETNVNNAITRVNQLGSTVTGMDTQLRNFASQIEAQRIRLNEIVETANNLSTRFSNLQTIVNDLGSKANAMDTQLKDFATRFSNLQAFVNDLDRRLKAVEGKQPFVFPQIKLPI